MFQVVRLFNSAPFRPHRCTTWMRPIVMQKEERGLSVCLSVTVVSPEKYGGPDRDAIWVVHSDGPGQGIMF